MVADRKAFDDVTEEEEEEDRNERSVEDVVTNSSDAELETVVIKSPDLNTVTDLDLRPNDQKILELLQKQGSVYTFRGLTRKLGLHQESLSRSLNRLRELGFVEKSQLGYKLVERPFSVTKSDNDRKGTVDYIPLLQSYIPATISLEDIVKFLAGRWFKNLQWLGMIEGSSSSTLQWTSDDGSFQLNLRIMGRYVIMETNVDDERNKTEALVSVYRIFEQLTELYRQKQRNVFSYMFLEEKPLN